MQGYDRRSARAIADGTFATALALLKERVRWLLLSVDVIGLDRSFSNRVRRSVARRLGMSPACITIISSHTHSGPATLYRLGAVPADKDYLKFLESRLTAAAEQAAAQFRPVRWRFGMTSLAENVNRRVRFGNRIELGVDSAGPVDQRLRVLRLDPVDEASTPLALVVHYAFHATTSGDSLEISADWPGAMRNQVREFYGGSKDPAVLFLQGCTGDLTHRIGRDKESWPGHFGRHSTMQSQALGTVVGQACIEASERSEQLDATDVQVAVKPVALPYYKRRGRETSEVQVARIGPERHGLCAEEEAVWFVGLPGEPFTQYSTDFGREFHRILGASADRTLVCGYTNDCVGYLCTPQALEEGGYEAAVAHRMYHRPAPFAETVETLLLDHSLSAAREIQGMTSDASCWKQAISRLAGRAAEILSGGGRSQNGHEH
jgi:hypothetical protein